jgi:TrmH family RNA methyltransferase
MSLRIVLVRPRNAENLGAIARAMKNFGLTDWAVVSPNPLLLESENARQLAVHAQDTLERVRVCGTVEEAVADCVGVVGTSMRPLEGLPAQSPREVAEWAHGRAGTVALLFGDERSGLRNDELARCHALSRIPSSDAQPSLNLAQAVLLYCYEARLAALSSHPPRPVPKQAGERELRFLKEQLGSVLEASGLHSPTRIEKVVQKLSAPWLRGGLSATDVRLWNQMLGNLRKHLS